MATDEQRDEIKDPAAEVRASNRMSPSGLVSPRPAPRKPRVPWKQTDTAND